MRRLITDRPCPVVITCRRPADGGKYAGSEEQRLLLLRTAIAEGVEYVDLEADIASAIPRFGRTQRIISHHDFHKTPSLARLRTLCQAARRAGADVFKVAAVADKARDVAVLLDFLTERRAASPALAVMGMGAFGKVSRLVFAQAGSVLNYGYLDRPQVPGQWPAELLKQRLAELA